MTNDQLIDFYLAGCQFGGLQNLTTTAGSLSIDGARLLSYGEPIVEWDGAQFWVSNNSPSKTTSKQISAFTKALLTRQPGFLKSLDSYAIVEKTQYHTVAKPVASLHSKASGDHRVILYPSQTDALIVAYALESKPRSFPEIGFSDCSAVRVLELPRPLRDALNADFGRHSWTKPNAKYGFKTF